MLSARRTGAAILTTFVLATLTACGMEESPITAEADNGGDFSLGPKVTMSFDLDGSTTLKGEQTALAPSLNGTFLKNCEEYSRGTERDDGKTLFAMGGLLDGAVDGRKVTVELWIDDYAGPGAYPKDQLVAPGSRPSIAIDNVIYGTWPDTTSSKVTTTADGGGAWTFKKLAATGPGGLPGDAVSGSIKWTCQNP